jgi:hypothetical protein
MLKQFFRIHLKAVWPVLAADLSQRLHRSSNTSALRELLLRWNRPLISLRSVVYDTQHSLKIAFGISKKAAWTTFATWDHFAIACINSQTPMAREMKEFFLQAGEQYGMNALAEAETGLSVHQIETLAQRFEQRFDAIELRLVVPTPHDIAEQLVMAMRITNFENLIRVGHIGNIRVGSHKMGLAYEALVGFTHAMPKEPVRCSPM